MTKETSCQACATNRCQEFNYSRHGLAVAVIGMTDIVVVSTEDAVLFSRSEFSE